MASLCSTLSVESVVACRATSARHQASASSRRVSLASAFTGTTLSAAPVRPAQPSVAGKRPAVRATTVATDTKTAVAYRLPTWARFELGLAPVYWESAAGGTPTAGELMTIWFNPEASSLTPNPDFGVAFNGGFNSPIMCGSEARRMTQKDRGPKCSSLFSIRVNVPKHAKTIEFSMTDGSQWDGPYVVEMQLHPSLQGQSIQALNEALAAEMALDGACDNAIFPDSEYIPDRCLMPGGLDKEEGLTCSLDIVKGCMDPSSPLYDPLATVDDGSCPIDVPQKQ
eukprot:TRINITY_DN4229_c0_g1_i1.p1 TRINITY_DN4229_c0_g1~~TRINITY_DN4229_c0_g1_i1.p1  ORF type:complete len:301 (-),score=-6.17 TRINITY_DN4229_c0_g1_i1:397-1245(-)